MFDSTCGIIDNIETYIFTMRKITPLAIVKIGTVFLIDRLLQSHIV
jgi:hypothetical protein